MGKKQDAAKIRIEAGTVRVELVVELRGRTPAMPPSVPDSQSETQPPPPSRIESSESVGGCLAHWRRAMEAAGRHERTIAQQISRVEHFAAFAGLEDLGDATAEHALDWFAYISENGMPRRKSAGGARKIGGIGPDARRNHHAGMRSFWEWLARAEMIPAGRPNPWDAVVVPSKSKKQRRAFTLEETAALIAVAEADEESTAPRCRWSDGEVVHRSSLYWVLATTGLRIGTATAIRWRDLALDAETPTITVRGRTGSKEPEDRVEVLPEPTAASLRRWKAISPDAEPPAQVWRRPRADVLKSDQDAAGVPKTDGFGRAAGFHAFRRYLGTQLAKNGEPHSITGKILGHKNFSTTNRYYIDRAQIESVQPVAKVGRQIEAARTQREQENHARSRKQTSQDVDRVSTTDDQFTQENPPLAPPRRGRRCQDGGSGRDGVVGNNDPPGVDALSAASVTGSSPVTPIRREVQTDDTAEILSDLAGILHTLSRIQMTLAQRIAVLRQEGRDGRWEHHGSEAGPGASD